MMVLGLKGFGGHVGSGTSSVGHEAEFHGEASFNKFTPLVLSVFSLRQLDFIQVVTSVMHALKLFLVLGVCLKETISVACRLRR